MSEKKTKLRSPEHPSMDLKAAIERARQFYDEEHFNKAPYAAALNHWGYTEKSSSGARTVAALRHFGLFDEEGSKEDRVVWLTDRGKTLVLNPDKDSEETRREVRAAALSPSIYEVLWDEWRGEGRLPSDRSMRYLLERDFGFNPKSIDGFIEDFRSTLDFAGLLDSPGDEQRSDTAEETQPEPDAEAPARPPEARPSKREPTPPPPSTSEGSTSGSFELPIPLDAGTARLYVPTPLSDDDFEVLRRAIEMNLELFRSKLVK